MNESNLCSSTGVIVKAELPFFFTLVFTLAVAEIAFNLKYAFAKCTSNDVNTDAR
jgi:hypothetical protein